MPSILDWFRIAVLVLGLGYVARQDRKTWFWAESVLWGFYSTIIFLFPSFMFPGQESSTLFFVVRSHAAQVIAAQYLVFNTKRTYDENVIGTVLWAKIISSLLMVCITGYSYSQKNDLFSNKTLYFDAVAMVLTMLSAVYKMYQGQYRVGGREGKDHVSTICRFFFLICFVHAVSMLAFPSWVYFKKPELLESVTMRLAGAMGIGWSIVWWYSSTFRDDRDRSTVFKCVFLSSFLMFCAMCLAYFHDETMNRQEFLGLHVAFVPLPLAVLGQYLIWKNESVSSSYYLRSKIQ